jgi:hypothetical protein
VKLWFDEDLSPTLVQVANGLGFEATCNLDRGMLGASDPELRFRGEHADRGRGDGPCSARSPPAE